MKHKKIIFLIFLCIIIYLIYSFFHDDKISYIAIGDSLSAGVNSYGEKGYGYSDYVADYLRKNDKLRNYYNGFATPGYRISDLKNQIVTNQTLEYNNSFVSLKKSLRESSLVTVSIGGNDLLSNISLSTSSVETLDDDELIEIIDQMVIDLDDLLKEIRKYAKREVVLLGYYNTLHDSAHNIKRTFAYLDSKTNEVCKKYDVTYISLYSLFENNEDFLPNPTNIHPNTAGYEAIANKIIKGAVTK